MSSKPDTFLEEYSSDAAVRRYTKRTAGEGISYLLNHEYGPLYLKTLREYVVAPLGEGLHLLEFGCGAGMNLIHLVSRLNKGNIPVKLACGTDFSGRLIQEAQRDCCQL